MLRLIPFSGIKCFPGENPRWLLFNKLLPSRQEGGHVILTKVADLEQHVALIFKVTSFLESACDGGH